MLRVVALALALQAARQAPPSPRDVPRVDPAALRDSAHAVLVRHFFDWGLVWRASIARTDSQPETLDSLAFRNRHLHCHPDGTTAVWFTRAGSMIRSTSGFYAVCPTWFVGTELRGDERRDQDVAMVDEYRGAIRVARASVLDFLAAMSPSLPGDDWLTGQRVRLHLSQREPDVALGVARECQATRWWCEALHGYVLAARDDIVAADSAFAAAVSLQPESVRCTWNDFTILLDTAGRRAYNATRCEGRGEIDRWLWWLSDPMWTEPGNPRRVEQHVRSVLVAMREQVGRDERFDWRPEAGGDALATMVRRYGWPSHLHWAGLGVDASHSTYLKTRQTALNEPYTTFEYSKRRVHAIPSWRAIVEPLQARADDWELRPPPGTAEVESTAHVWWPVEHFAAGAPIIQLPDVQVAFLRRDDAVIVAAAAELDTSHVERAEGDTVRGTLVLSDAPERLERVARALGTAGRTLVGYGTTTPRAALLGLEFPATATAPAGRTRLGVAPPPTLATLAPGSYAVSDPVVLRPPADGVTTPNDFATALSQMAGTLRVGRRSIGVYWETYGFRETDTVEVAVWVERHTPQGFARQLGNLLRVTQDLNTPLVVSWQEPHASRALRRSGNLVPILGRSVELDLSQLVPGEYWLDVAVAKPGQPAARGRRSIVIR